MPALNEQFIGRVRNIASDGKAVVEHPDGQVFFVPGVWTGEVGKFAVTGFKKRHGYARLIELLEPSSSRVRPNCQHHGFDATDCGGCPWQFIGYAEQLQAKQAMVTRALSRLDISTAIFPIWGSPDTYGYRNRAQFKTDGHRLGYVAQGQNLIAPIKDCPILTDHNRQTLKQLLSQLPKPDFKPSRRERWTTLDIDEDINADSVTPNQRRLFRQGNSAQNLRMRHWLAEHMAGLDADSAVLELFAGSGNFTEIITAAGFSHCLAVEASPEAIEQLVKKNLPNVDTLICNLFSDNGIAQVRRKLCRAEILVLDPPRDGFKNIDKLIKVFSQIKDIFYISCDLATFTRDISLCMEAGYGVREIQPLDQFPHTPHIELLAHLKNN